MTTVTILVGSSAFADAELIAELTDSLGMSIASQDWDATDSGYEQLYSAYKEEYGVASRQTLAMGKVLGLWKIQAYRNGLLSEDKALTIIDTSAFYATLVAEVEGQYGENASELIDPLYGQSMVEYHLFQIASRKPTADYLGVGPELTYEEVCVDTEDRGGAVQCDQQEVPSRDYLDSQAYAKSEETALHWDAIAVSLSRISEICQANQYFLDQAEAMVHLGDYYLYGGENSAALETYNAAYQLLNRIPDGAEWLTRLFVQPTVVPSLSTSLPGAAPAAITTHGMTFGFSISADGKAENLEILGGANAGNMTQQDSTIAIISGAVFRPYFDEDGVIESAPVEI